ESHPRSFRCKRRRTRTPLPSRPQAPLNACRLQRRMTGSFRSRPRDRRLDAPSEADQYLRSRFVAATAPSLESSMLALAWMYLGGASFAIAVIALAQRDRLTDPTIGTCIVLAYAIGVALLAGRRRLPSPAIDFGLAAGIMFVTVAVAK